MVNLFFKWDNLCYNDSDYRTMWGVWVFPRPLRDRNDGEELGMKQKITVTIAGQEYTLVAEESEAYVTRCAQLVDSQLTQVMDGARLGRSDAAVLAAMNLADQFYREQEAGENLRLQIKKGLDENARLKMELSEAKREIFKLQNQK